jgi:hypothetical protein
MKTIKNSILMRTIFVAIFAVSFTAFVNGQFLTPNPDSPVLQDPSEDIRTGSSVVYDLDNGSHVPGEKYKWVVTGGEITAVNEGVISGVDNNIVESTVDAHTITVNWDETPGSAIGSFAGQIQVQKVSIDDCPSQVQTLDVNIWNAPSASFTDVATEICSGDGAAASVTVDFTGAPDNEGGNGFTVNYTMDIPTGVTAFDGAGDPFVATNSASTNGASVDIDLPATFVNSTDGSIDFVLTLTTMTDDFGDSDDTVATGTYTITVYPVPETGDIESSVSLSRRL